MAKTVTHDEQGKTYFGNDDHLEVAQAASFARMVFELLSERAPSGEELRIFELILNLSIDHGPDTPSAIATIESAKSGKNISQSIAEGINQINDKHGGAMEPAMSLFYKIKAENLDVQSLVNEYIDQKRLIGGFGHRLYKTEDPRAELILSELEKLEKARDFIEIARKLQDAIEKKKGVRLVINIDGSIAVALCSFGWDPKLGTAVFLIARTPGLCGQYLNALKNT